MDIRNTDIVKLERGSGHPMPERVSGVAERIGGGLKRLRKSSGLTQTAAAERVGWRQSKIAEIETGRRKISLEDFLTLVGALGFDPSVAIAQIHSSE